MSSAGTSTHTLEVSAKEASRWSWQTKLDLAKAPEARNQLGQFSTPIALAKAVVHSGLRYLTADTQLSFLDPAFGTGAFYSALLSALEFEKRTLCAASGFEIDPHYGEPAKLLWQDDLLDLSIADFTLQSLPLDDRRFSFLVCNPPYVRHHHLSLDQKKRLKERTRKISGRQISGLAGLYCHFLLQCHSWMAPKGVACWLIPSEFMDVNYGSVIKDYLLEQVTLLRIHRFDPNDVQFSDALVSSAILYLRNEPPDNMLEQSVEFSLGGSLLEPLHTKQVSVSELRKARKWSGFPLRSEKSRPTLEHSRHVAKIGDLFTIRRGVATGANDFFILDETDALKLRLPDRFLQPVLPSPRHLKVQHILREESGLPALERRQYLLRCNLDEATLKRTEPELWRYLESGRADVATRYLCKNRSPWYRQEVRPAAPIVCTYLGRSDKPGKRPFRFIFNESDATITNVYLALYPKSVLSSRPDFRKLIHFIWSFLNELPPEELLGEGRVYGGGLHKLEPKELARVSLAGLEEYLNLPLLEPEQLRLFD